MGKTPVDEFCTGRLSDLDQIVGYLRELDSSLIGGATQTGVDHICAFARPALEIGWIAAHKSRIKAVIPILVDQNRHNCAAGILKGASPALTQQWQYRRWYVLPSLWRSWRVPQWLVR